MIKLEYNIHKMFDYLELPKQLVFDHELIVLNVLIALMLMVVYKIIKAHNLFNSIILGSILSLMIVLTYLMLAAPDVAMPEAALNACLSTTILLVIINKIGDYELAAERKKLTAILLCTLIAGFLIYVGTDLTEFANQHSPIHTGVSKYYIENTSKDIGTPSIVAAILGSYRGFDTLGETIVILTAGFAVLLIFANKKPNLTEEDA